MGSRTPFYRYKLLVSMPGTISGSAMRILRAAIFFSVVAWTVVSAKIYQRCELARELRNFDIPEREIPTWVCIAQHESLLDTAAMNRGSGDHGLFQISQIYWCSPPGYGCNAPCDKFRDDDIADDLQCIRRIYNEHKRISGDGFSAWVVYSLYCKGDTSVYLAGCTDDADKPTTIPGNSTENEISSEEDEDGDGYEFPPLPSYPKSNKNVSELPYNKKSIHDYVLASNNGIISTKTETSGRLPFSKKSIHHFISVDTKLQELKNFKSDSTTESVHDFKLIPESTKEPTNFEELSHTTEKTVSRSNKPIVKMTFKTAVKESSTTLSNRPIFIKESIHDFKLVSSTTEKIQHSRTNEQKLTYNQTSQETGNKHSNKNILRHEADVGFTFLVKSKTTIPFEMTKKPTVSYQINQNKFETARGLSTSSSYQNTTPKNIKITDLEVRSSTTIRPVFLKSNSRIGNEKSSIKELNSSSGLSNKSGNKILTSTTTESHFTPNLLSRFKDINPSTTKLSSTTVQPRRAPKQVTFAPGTFFNIQTLPPILPPRPLRPPTERPRPNNRPGGPPKPIRPGGQNIIQASNETLPERPVRPGPNRRPVYTNANTHTEADVANENLPVKPFRPGFGPNRRPAHYNANFNTEELAGRPETINETPPGKPLRPGFGYNRKPAFSNTNSNLGEPVIAGRPTLGHNRRHQGGRAPNRSRSMLKDDNENEENKQEKNSKSPESKVVTLNGNYKYYRTKYGFSLNRNV